MSKSSKLAQSSAKSGFNVLWGLIFSSIVNAVGTIIIGNALGDEFGLIAIVLSGPTMITYIRDLGIDQAIIRYATKYRTEKDYENLKNIILVGTSFEIIIGIFFTVVSIFLSGVMASLLDRPTIMPLIQISSFFILASGIQKLAQSVFIGYEKMEFHSLTLVFQSVLKVSLMIALVSLNYGTYGAIIGQILGVSTAALASIALLYLTIIAKVRKQNGQLHFISTLKSMLTFGLPLSLAGILGGVLMSFLVFITAIYVNDMMMSNYSMSQTFASLVTVFGTTVSTVMFPTFSKIKGFRDTKTLQSVFQYSVKYTSLLIIPLTFAIMALSEPGVETLFQDKFEVAPLFLSLYCLNFLYTSIGSLSAPSLINSQGKTSVNLKLALLTFILGVTLGLVLIPVFGVLGLLFAIFICLFPSNILRLFWVKKYYNATVDWRSSIKIVSVSAFSAALTYLVINQFNLTSWIGLLVGAPTFLATYVVCAPMIGAITYYDTQKLNDAVKPLGPLAIFIGFLLYPIEKIAKAKER